MTDSSPSIRDDGGNEIYDVHPDGSRIGGDWSILSPWPWRDACSVAGARRTSTDC